MGGKKSDPHESVEQPVRPALPVLQKKIQSSEPSSLYSNRCDKMPFYFTIQLIAKHSTVHITAAGHNQQKHERVTIYKRMKMKRHRRSRTNLIVNIIRIII